MNKATFRQPQRLSQLVRYAEEAYSIQKNMVSKTKIFFHLNVCSHVTFPSWSTSKFASNLNIMSLGMITGIHRTGVSVFQFVSQLSYICKWKRNWSNSGNPNSAGPKLLKHELMVI